MDRVARRGTIDALHHAMAHQFFVAQDPDIPNLLNGPDILATQPGWTIAAFVPTKRETANTEQLQARLVLSRLSLPADAVTLLVVSDGDNFTSDFVSKFTITAAISEFSERMARGLPRRPHAPIPSYVRAWNQYRAGLLNALARDPSRARRLIRSSQFPAINVDVDQPLAMSRLYDLGLPRTAEVQLHDSVVVAYAGLRARTIRGALEPLLPATLAATFNSDGEHVELTTRLVAVLVMTAPDIQLPVHAVRSAAFAGWAVFSGELPFVIVDALSGWLRSAQ
jgi:hypothetical protein